MAKFEEADPRWKVQDMGQQGRNVNNWHWTENDCFPWFKEQFRQAFEEVSILTAPASKPGLVGELTCTKVDKCSGEASLSRRKGKKIMLLYELELNVKWESTVKNEAGDVVSTSKGSYNMPCIDIVEAIDGFEIQTKFNKDSAEHEIANAFAKSAGCPKVRDTIVAIIKKLQEEAQQSSPAPAATDKEPGASAQVLTTALKAAAIDATHFSAKHQPSGKVDGTIQLSTDFNAPVKELFECFTVPQRLMAYTQSRVQIGTKPGDLISLFDGSITGSVVECEPEAKLVWKWRQSSWVEGIFSTCTIKFSENGPGCSRVSVTQTGIPASDAHGNDDMIRVVEEGWKRNLLDRIKMVFGYGVPEFH